MKYALLISIAIAMIACSPESETETLSDYPNADLLWSAEQLHEQLDREDLFLIDAREELSDSLIPGAVHFAAIPELTDPDHPVESYLIGPELFEEKMKSIGLNNDHKVVIYDEGNSLASARLFYALEYYGFSGASVLDGGIQGWLDADYDVFETPAEKEEGAFVAEVQETRMCDITYISEAVDDPGKIIVDARSEDEYTGEDVRAERGGHIPGAVHLEWSDVLQSNGIPYFLPAQTIQDQYTALGITPDKEVIPHCQTNVRGAHTYFTLRLMGYDSVRPYEGSWSEYGNRADAAVN